MPKSTPSTLLSQSWDMAMNQARLKQNLDSIQAAISHIHDPEHGPVGPEFLNRFGQTGCVERPAKNSACIAAYQSFIYPPSPKTTGFTNAIAYGPAACDNTHLLFSAVIHERIHAMQKASAPILHASPYNSMTHIILCPRDWLTVQERCEQDAYAKQAWINSLYATQAPEIYKTSNSDPVSAHQFEILRKKRGDLESALHHTARTVMDCNFYNDDTAEKSTSLQNPTVTFSDHYHDLALDNYANIIKARMHDHAANIIFVRMDADDILSIGNSFGPNPFAQKGQLNCAPAFARPSTLSFNDKFAIRKLNHDLGIVDDRCLPTFRQALAALGTNPASFMAQTYNGKKQATSAKPAQP